MGKLQALEVLNEVLRNIGESTVSSGSLTSLTGIQLLAWNKITEALQDICTDQDAHYTFLENLGTVPLTTGNNAYTITGLTSGSNLQQEDIESFRSSDANRAVKYVSPQEFDAMYPKGITTDMTGYPEFFTKYAGQFVFNKQPTSAENGKNIDFRFWRQPNYYSTSTETGTSDIPEPFDRTLLVALATFKVLTYLGNEEAALYKIQVFGNQRDEDVEGSLDKLKRMYSSPKLKPRMTYQF
jgi:hypothetical protein